MKELSHSTGCSSSHWGWGGQEHVEMHANTVRACVCVCVCVCVELHISVSKGSAGGCTSEVSPCLSLFSSPLKWWKLVLYKDPFQQGDSSLTESTYHPSLPLFFLSVSHPLSSILNPSNQRCAGRWGCHYLEKQHCIKERACIV